MKRAVVYSKRHRSREEVSALAEAPPSAAPSASTAPAAGQALGAWRALALVLLGAALATLGMLAGMLLMQQLHPAAPKLTQQDIDAAVLHSLNTQDLPSPAARAAAAVQGAVVRVQGFEPDPKKPNEDRETGVGTGVVIKDDGTILTNYHVVWGAPRLVVTFADGTQSPAEMVGVHPHKDLAVLKPQKIPDDLQPAVLGSSRQLAPGDGVVAVGFPFGMGPPVDPWSTTRAR